MGRNRVELKAVCDAGPIIHLDELQVLHLLSDFDRVLVPAQVWLEVKKHRADALNHSGIKFEKVIVENPPSGVLSGMSKAFGLDAGEIEALSVAQRSRNCILFTDDAAARLVASQMGLKVHGTIGLIVRAIRRKRLSAGEVADILASVPQKSTLYIKPALLHKIIQDIKREYRL